MPPDPPSKERLRRSLVRIINWSHPPVKNPGYGPALWAVFSLQDLWKRFQFVLDQNLGHFEANLFHHAKIVTQAML